MNRSFGVRAAEGCAFRYNIVCPGTVACPPGAICAIWARKFTHEAAQVAELKGDAEIYRGLHAFAYEHKLRKASHLVAVAAK